MKNKHNTRVHFLFESSYSELKTSVDEFCQGRLIVDIAHIGEKRVMITYLYPRITPEDHSLIIEE